MMQNLAREKQNKCQLVGHGTWNGGIREVRLGLYADYKAASVLENPIYWGEKEEVR